MTIKFSSFKIFNIKTHEVDLKSDIGMQLKREMLITIAKKDTDLYPNDKEKQQLIYNRYKEFEIPVRNKMIINFFKFFHCHLQIVSKYRKKYNQINLRS